jgi:hypothetical protein
MSGAVSSAPSVELADWYWISTVRLWQANELAAARLGAGWGVIDFDGSTDCVRTDRGCAWVW